MRTHYCYPTAAGRMYSKHYDMKLSLQNFYCLFPLMHYNISVSLWKKKPLTVIALLHQSPWKWIFKCESPSTFPFPQPSPLPPQSNLNQNVVIAMLVIPLIMWWNGKKTQKHLLRFQSGKGWFSGPHHNKGDLVHTHLNFPKIIEVLYIDPLLFFFNQYNHVGLNYLARYLIKILISQVWATKHTKSCIFWNLSFWVCFTKISSEMNQNLAVLFIRSNLFRGCVANKKINFPLGTVKRSAKVYDRVMMNV